jgi:hypothetical protein
MRAGRGQGVQNCQATGAAAAAGKRHDGVEHLTGNVVAVPAESGIWLPRSALPRMTSIARGNTTISPSIETE